MRITSTILASILGVGLLGCAASEQGGDSDPEPVDPSDPSDPSDPASPDDPAYSAKIEKTDYSLELIVRTMREIDDYDLTTPGGDVDVMWREFWVIEGKDYDIHEMRLALDPLSTLNTLAFHDGYVDFVARDTLGFEIGSTAFQLAITTPSYTGNWQPEGFAVGSGPNGYTGSMRVTPMTEPSGTPTAHVVAEGDSYDVTISNTGGNYVVRWTQVAMGMCLMAQDCALNITSGGTTNRISMGVSASANTTVGPN